MEKSMINRIGKALLLAIFITGALYATGYENYKAGSLNLGAKVGLAIFLRFLIFFGILNLVNLLKNRKKNSN